VYFGNALAISNSNGEDTFIFFDDFDDGTIDVGKWETYGPWTESGGVASFSIVGTGGTSVLPDLMSNETWDMRNKSIASRWRVKALTVNREWGVSCADTVGDDHTRLSYFLALNTSGNDNVRSYYDANAAPGYDYYNLIIGQYPPSVFMKTEFVSTPNNVTKNSWILDGNVLDTYSGNSFDSTPQRIFLGFYVHGYTNTLVSGNLEMEFDYVYLRNQVSTEIAHGAWGALESEPEDGLNWLSGWEFRKPHTLLGSHGVGHDFQIKIIVHFGDGFDSEDTVYCNNKSLSDFADIRFTDNDGVTPLDHWLESYFDSENATFWVEVRDTLDYDQTIHTYFGNPSAVSASNGVDTFPFFEDWSGGAVDWNKWEFGQTNGSVSFSTSSAQHGYVIKVEGNPGQNRYSIQTVSQFPTGYSLRFRANAEATAGADQITQIGWGTWGENHELFVKSYQGIHQFLVRDDDWVGSDGDYPISVSNFNSWHVFDIARNGTHAHLYSDDVHVVTADGSPDLGDTSGLLYCRDSEYDLYNDWMLVRKYTDSEPVHGLWGASESAMTLDSPADLTYEAGTTGHTIEWSVFSFHPARYLRMLNFAILDNITWDGSDVGISVDGLDPGSHSYTLQIFNTFGYSLIDSVTVNVEDTTDPVLTHPESVEYTEGTPGNTIEWTMDDLYPSGYELHIDGDLLLSGDWNTTGESLTISVDGLPAGLYNFSLAAIDESGNSAIDYVTVTVQPNYTTIILMVGVAGVVLIIGVISCRAKKS
jgi:hypothetical protein